MKTLKSAVQPVLGLLLLSISAHASEMAGAMSQFMDWNQKNGVNSTKVVPVNGQYGWGLQASRAIAKGEVILRIPQSLFLCDAVANDIFGGGAITRLESEIVQRGGIVDNVRLGLVLLAERARGKESFWGDWLDLYPSEILGIHQASQDDVDDVMNGTDVQVSWKKVAQSVETTKQVIMEFKPELLNNAHIHNFDFNLYDISWAISMSASRHYGGAVFAENAENHCFIPMVDFANHNPRSPKIQMMAGNMFGYVANAALEPGSAIHWEYHPSLTLETVWKSWSFSTGTELPTYASMIITDLMGIMIHQELDALFNFKQSLFMEFGCPLGAKTFPFRDDYIEKALLVCARLIFLKPEHIQHLDLENMKAGLGSAVVHQQLQKPLVESHERHTLTHLHRYFEQKCNHHLQWKVNNHARLAALNRPGITALMGVRESILQFWESVLSKWTSMLSELDSGAKGSPAADGDTPNKDRVDHEDDEEDEYGDEDEDEDREL